MIIFQLGQQPLDLRLDILLVLFDSLSNSDLIFGSLNLLSHLLLLSFIVPAEVLPPDGDLSLVKLNAVLLPLLVELVVEHSAGFLLVHLENRNEGRFLVNCLVSAAVYRENGEYGLVVSGSKGIEADMREEIAGKLELGGVHQDQLVHTVQEEHEVRAVLTGVIYCCPGLHLFLGLLDVGRDHLALDWLTIFSLKHQAQALDEVVEVEVPLFVDKGTESFECAVVGVGDELDERG